jgi:chorismate dehydratase
MKILPVRDNENPLRIGRISYINADPVYYAFDRDPMPSDIRVIRRPPAVLNRLLKEKALDISSVSASSLARNSGEWMLLPDLSISCYGKVLSVLLVSRYSFADLEGCTVLLTDESATAVDLVRLIFCLKGVSPVFKVAKVKSIKDLEKDKTAMAGLVIGDAALKHRWGDAFEHVWDLCEIWNEMTGLPFVFAVWAVQRDYAEKYPRKVLTALEKLKTSKESGLRNLPEIVKSASERIAIDPLLCKNYYHSMYYSMSQPEVQCLLEFFNQLWVHHIIDKKPELTFFNPVETYQAMAI